VGTGGSAKSHLSALRQEKDRVDIVAVVDISPQNLKSFVKKTTSPHRRVYDRALQVGIHPPASPTQFYCSERSFLQAPLRREQACSCRWGVTANLFPDPLLRRFSVGEVGKTIFQIPCLISAEAEWGFRSAVVRHSLLQRLFLLASLTARISVSHLLDATSTQIYTNRRIKASVGKPS
jgi:hypothetical protein